MKYNGIEVVDADSPITVSVTKADCRAGAKKNASMCAAAHSLCRQKGIEAARFHLSRAYVKKAGKWLRYSVSPGMRNEIIAFDRGGEFAPGEYILTPVQPSVRLDAPAKRKTGPRNGKFPQRGRRVKRAYHKVSGVREAMQADWE